MEFSLLDPQVEKAVGHFRLFCGPKAIWTRAAAAARHLVAKGQPRARTKTEKLPPGASLV